jgi:hypothetical protein
MKTTKTESKARAESLRKYLSDVAMGVDTVKAFNDHKERMKMVLLKRAA